MLHDFDMCVDFRNPLGTYFRNSLRFLPLQDIIELYSLCQSKNIDALLFSNNIIHIKKRKEKDHYDWSHAITMSQNYDQGIYIKK